MNFLLELVGMFIFLGLVIAYWPIWVLLGITLVGLYLLLSNPALFLGLLFILFIFNVKNK